MARPFPFPKRARNSHKGDYGRLAFIAGSLDMPGAACLAALAAMQAGAGMATVLSVKPLFPLITIQYPELMGVPLKGTDDGDWTESAITHTIETLHVKRIDHVVIGPGLGTSDAIHGLVAAVLDWTNEYHVPVVCDADALNAYPIRHWSKRQSPTVITPHPKEYERFVAGSEYTSDCVSMDQLSSDYNIIVAYKTHQTRVVQHTQRYTNMHTGNPGMATAGSGDVLAGMIGAYLAQYKHPFEATSSAVYDHGRVGDCCEAVNGVAFTARDMVTYISDAISKGHA